MCGRYQLVVEFDRLHSLLKKNFPKGLEENYAPQALIKLNDPVLVLETKGKLPLR
tara:strand:- start:216 stop:380 length:165 start_codon:yes stop_codon:yes gene_type:complete